MKTIADKTPIRLTNWKSNQVATVTDMKMDPDPWYGEHCTDEDRLFGSPKPCFLSSNPADYDRINAEYANPIEVEDGELVRLASNGKVYKVKCMGWHGCYDYITDLLHFELQK